MRSVVEYRSLPAYAHLMSHDSKQFFYYGYLYGLIFAGLLTGAKLADSHSSWTDVATTTAIGVLFIAPTLACVGLVVGLIIDRVGATRFDRRRKQ